MYLVLLSKQAVKDLTKLKAANLSQKAKALVNVLKDNPYTPPYEKLVGNLSGFYSRRINIQHRMVYTINEQTHEVLIVSMWSHYEQ